MSTIVTIAASVIVAATAVMNIKLDHTDRDRASAVAGLAVTSRNLRSMANGLNAELGGPVQLDELGWQFTTSDAGRDGDKKEGPGDNDDEDSLPVEASEVALPARRIEALDPIMSLQDGGRFPFHSVNSAPVDRSNISLRPANTIAS